MNPQPDASDRGAVPHFDIFVIGGGVNGAGIARDAAGRGYSVCLCDAGDFGSGTSSASTKLFHGGLRYLEHFEFRLVREALIERENLLRAMPHIAWPLRFVLPYHPDMRFEGGTPASRLLGLVFPWMKGSRPAWLIRFGLFLYDHMGGRELLPPTTTIDLRTHPAGRALKADFTKAFEYSDCWVEDSRLVILNLRDAEALGARIQPRTPVTRARFADGRWHIGLLDKRTGQTHEVTASVMINATGPWLDEVLKSVFGQNDARNIRLVRGSHIVVPEKFDHEDCYFFQNADGRVMFAIPYEEHYTLIGTTDADQADMHEKPRISAAEIYYLCTMASAWFADPVKPEDIAWTYSGVRALHDDGTTRAQEATRDYLIRRDAAFGEAPLFNVIGGKITTYRKLAETMLEEIEAVLGVRGKPWTCGAALPGGDFPVDGFESLVERFARKYPFVEGDVMRRYVRLYGTETGILMGDAASIDDLGRHFGNGLYQAELHYLMRHEWAREAEDVVFRRTRLGIAMSKSQIAALDAWMAEQR